MSYPPLSPTASSPMLPLHAAEELEVGSSSKQDTGFFGALRRRPMLRWALIATPICLLLILVYATALHRLRLPPTSSNTDPANSRQRDQADDGRAFGIVGAAGGKVDRRPAPPSNSPALTQDWWLWKERKDLVKASFLHAWKGYRSKAFPKDELLPENGQAKNSFNGWSVTLVDSLSTMWVMGLRDEFNEAVSQIRQQNFTSSTNGKIPFFETVIRHLGGYLSAYALSGDPILLSLADDLGRVLLPAFNTASSLPAYSVSPQSSDPSLGGDGTGSLAEMGTCQLEFKYLAKMTGRSEYYRRSEGVMDHFYKSESWEGLFAEHWVLSTGKPIGEHYTIGAGADSAYEYFLKQWLLDGDKRALTQYLKSTEGIINNLLYVSPNRKLLYATDVSRGNVQRGQQHLSCFLPGMFALGAHTIPPEYLSQEVRQKHQWVAEGLTYTCWVMYADQKSGVGPDGVMMADGGQKWVDALRAWKAAGSHGKPPGLTEPPPERDESARDYSNGGPGYYILRPETAESVYYMWKTTGNSTWRERGYAMYEAIERHTKTTYGYSNIRDVDSDHPQILNEMPSFFLAETLKYFYMMTDDEDPVSLDRWVFNTEAHPLPKFSWTEQERAAFKISS